MKKALKYFILGGVLGSIMIVFHHYVILIFLERYNPHSLGLARGDLEEQLRLNFEGDCFWGLLYACALGGYLAGMISLTTKTLRPMRYALFFLAPGMLIVMASTYITMTTGNWDVAIAGLPLSGLWGVILAVLMIRKG